MKSRPRNLREALAAAQNAAAGAVADPFEGEVPLGANNGDKELRRGILVRVSPALWRQIKIDAFNRGISVQALMTQAITGVLASRIAIGEPEDTDSEIAAAGPRR